MYTDANEIHIIYECFLDFINNVESGGHNVMYLPSYSFRGILYYSDATIELTFCSYIIPI